MNERLARSTADLLRACLAPMFPDTCACAEPVPAHPGLWQVQVSLTDAAGAVQRRCVTAAGAVTPLLREMRQRYREGVPAQ